MTSPTSITRDKSGSGLGPFFKVLGITLAVGGLFIGMLALIWFTQTPAGAPIAETLQSLFAMDTVQAWWYVTRAAGLTSYFVLWLSMVWGMAIPSRFFSPAVEGTYSYDFHEFLSLLGLGFALLHIIVLLFDQFLPFSIWQILIPFTDAYRPLWVGLGIIGAYIFLLVTVTFYLRRTIGTQTFRSIHLLSLVGYLGATLHGLFAGTDSALPLTRVLYVGTSLIVLFLTIYWIVIGALAKREQAIAAEHAARERRQAQRLTQNRR
jgi:predicted ferric reductase